MRIYGGCRGRTNIRVKHFSYFDDVTVGVIGSVIDADVAMTCTGEGCETSNVGGCVAGNIADAVAFAGYYLNGV